MNRARIDALQKCFPECVVECVDEHGSFCRKIDVGLLKQTLDSFLSSQGATTCSELYEFTWQGKKAAKLNAVSETTKKLSPERKESVYWERTGNIYVEGENLDALKLLRTVFDGKIKVVYIDPPYNTGSDLVYGDDFRVSCKKWKETNNKRLTTVEAWNLSEQGRIHSVWCSMFYSRVIVARELLADDGVMLVSIDDREMGNASKILDEVFGESMHLATFVWETKTGAKGIPPTSMCVKNHEYILAYGKSPSFRFRGERREEAEGFRNPDGDPRGPWKRQYLQRFGQGFQKRNVVDPETGVVYSFETPYTEAKMRRLVQDKRIIFPTEPNRYPVRKEFFSEYSNPDKPVLTSLGLFSTKVGSEELKKLFNGVKVFDYPKPLRLMVELLRKTIGQKGVVLDFFSGSGTTAHAVMTLNAEDGGDRRFICIQRPEKCEPNSAAFKAGFKTVSEIGRERLRLAGRKILEERTDAGRTPDVGFRVYKVMEQPEKS